MEWPDPTPPWKTTDSFVHWSGKDLICFRKTALDTCLISLSSASAAAQELRGSITSIDAMIEKDQTLYLSVTPNSITGYLKIGTKHLYYRVCIF